MRKPPPTLPSFTARGVMPTTSAAESPTRASSTPTTAISVPRVPSRATRPSPLGRADSLGSWPATPSSWSGSLPFPRLNWSRSVATRPSKRCSSKLHVPPVISTSSTRRPMAFPIGTPVRRIFTTSATTSTALLKSKTTGNRLIVPPPRLPRRASSASVAI